MDSGTPLDIISRKDIQEHKERIIPIKPLCISTANGESRADKGIALWLSTLGEDITPYVLEDTPNALSLGRRCVDGGYDWVWLGGTTCTYIVHPAVRAKWGPIYDPVPKSERIAMRVEDYCPYLGDPGSTFAAVDGFAAAACSVVRPVASAPMVRTMPSPISGGGGRSSSSSSNAQRESISTVDSSGSSSSSSSSSSVSSSTGINRAADVP